MPNGEMARYLVFKLVCQLSSSWRRVNAPNQLTLPLAGRHFVGGRLNLDTPREDQTT